MWVWLTSAVLACALLVRFWQQATYFSRRGVKALPPLPLLGNMARYLLNLEDRTTDVMRPFNAFPGERFVGRYQALMKPIIVIRDVELVKNICIKDFEHFTDHNFTVDPVTDPMFGRNLTVLKGHIWKDMRSTYNPIFSTSKMKIMVPLMEEVTGLLIKSFKEQIELSKDGFIDIYLVDVMKEHALDVMASIVFGLDVDSPSYKSSQFRQMASDVSSLNFKQTVKMLSYCFAPRIAKALKLSVCSKDQISYFMELLTNSMKKREELGIVRPDIVQLIMEIKKEYAEKSSNSVKDTSTTTPTSTENNQYKKSKRVWADLDLLSQAVGFLAGGGNTLNAAASFLLHELAVNPDVQARLLQEIRDSEAAHGPRVHYARIQGLKYLDMVVSESLRLWAPPVALTRVCTKDYNLGKPNDAAKEDYIIRKGESVKIPVWGFHRDPRCFPEPLRFNPERFSDQNKHDINPYAYMPFGLGPRQCIGRRLAIMEMKVMVYLVVRDTRLEPCGATRLPVQLSTYSFSTKLEKGHQIRIRTRK